MEQATRFVSIPTCLVQARKNPFTNSDTIKMMFNRIPAEKEMF
ncbi:MULTISPECIES: hypothetical protein [unclassified Roseobacter]|nr:MULTISPECIES: hypothetical protein [unclassified Roseobacter]